MSILFRPLLSGLAFFVIATTADAGGGPVFNPATSSYFEIQELESAQTWMSANLYSRSQVYKGRRGRLALIKAPETQAFVEENFRITEGTWIGLRYWCSNKKSQWLDGEYIIAGSFRHWHPAWVRDPRIQCTTANMPFMAVYLTSRFEKLEYFWQATGMEKHMKYALIEYAAGK